MHCGYPSLLLCILGAELVVAATLNRHRRSDELKNDVENLQRTLSNLWKWLSNEGFSADTCPDRVPHLDKGASEVFQSLSKLQTCTALFSCLNTDKLYSDAVTLNGDLLLHLGAPGQDKASDNCQLRTQTPDLNDLIEPLQCLQCWIQQVAALKKDLVECQSSTAEGGFCSGALVSVSI